MEELKKYEELIGKVGVMSAFEFNSSGGDGKGIILEEIRLLKEMYNEKLRKYTKLEEENKNLKEENKNLKEDNKNLKEDNSNPLKKKLNTLYEHEKHLFTILKDYKEEIKFAVNLQEDIRREEAKFFSATLKEVCDSLRDEQINKECAEKWIEDLVASYTSSLKLSYQLTDENIMTSIGNIKEEINNTINQINE